MKAINDWANVQEAGGEIQNLPAGGYVCRIEACTEKPNKNSDGTHLEILFDVAEGEYKGFFMADWKAQTREDKFWRGIINQNVPDERSPKYGMQCGFFKRFTNAVEAGNPNYHWDWNEAGLAGKLIGVVFGEVERQSSRGTLYMTTRAHSIVSAEAIRTGKYKVPEPKYFTQSNAPVLTPVVEKDPDLPF